MIRNKKLINVGGWLMLLSGVLFISIPLIVDYLSADKHVIYNLEQFNLFKVSAGTPVIHFWLIIYALLPLLFIPSIVATYYMLKEKSEPTMLVALCLGLIGVTALTMSLLVLPSFDWYFLSHLPALNAQQQALIVPLLQGWHGYWGIFVGDMLGLGCLLGWIFITSVLIFYSKKFHYLLRLALLLISSLTIFILALHYYGATVLNYIQVTSLLMAWIFLCGMGLIFYSFD
jgi:hypothetical protein